MPTITSNKNELRTKTKPNHRGGANNDFKRQIRIETEMAK